MSGISGIRGENRDAGDGKNKQMKFVKRRTDFKVHSQIRKNERMMKFVLLLLFGKGRWYTDTKHYFLDDMMKYSK